MQGFTHLKGDLYTTGKTVVDGSFAEKMTLSKKRKSNIKYKPKELNNEIETNLEPHVYSHSLLFLADTDILCRGR